MCALEICPSAHLSDQLAHLPLEGAYRVDRPTSAQHIRRTATAAGACIDTSRQWEDLMGEQGPYNRPVLVRVAGDESPCGQCPRVLVHLPSGV